MTSNRKPTVWILTDGKAGDEQPLIGIAEALGVEPQLRRVRPRKPFTWLMPWGPIDPRDAPKRPGSPIEPPFPDICLATGRRAVAYLRTLKSASPKTLTVFFKDPRTKSHGADLIIVQRHDEMLGDDALQVTTAPNRLPASRLEAIRQAPPHDLAALPHPRIAVLVGGNSRHHEFTASDIDRLIDGLSLRLSAGFSLMITASRRTPDTLKTRLDMLADQDAVQYWTGEGENPLAAYLALADEVIVTADSTNMVGDAATTGKPIQVFHPTGGHPKINRFIEALKGEVTIGTFPDGPASGDYPPVNSTALIAKTILERRNTLTR